MCIVDDIAAKLRIVEDAAMIGVKLVMSRMDESVTQEGLPCPLTFVVGGGATTHCHSDSEELPKKTHNKHRAKGRRGRLEWQENDMPLTTVLTWK